MGVWEAVGTAWLRRTQACLLIVAVLAAVVSPFGNAESADRLIGILRPVVAVLSALLCWGASLRRRSADRRDVTAWRLLAAACVVLALGDVLNGWAGARIAPPVSVGDVALFGFYPLQIAGVWLLLRSGRPRWSPVMWWDGAVVAVATLASGVALLELLTARAPVTAAGTHGSGFTLADIGALAIVLGLVAINRSLVPSSVWWTAAALGVLSVSDVQAVIVAGAENADATLAVTLTSAGIVAAYVLLGLAAPDRRHDRTRHDWFSRAHGGRHSERVRAALLPTVAVLSAALVVLATLLDENLNRWTAAVALLALGLALIRLGTSLWSSSGVDSVAPARNTDDVTGLANRRALSDALRVEGNEAFTALSGDEAGTERAIAVLLVDLDRFKEVNDALGHAAGDRLLAAVGDRFSEALHDGQLLARLGGDEFAVVLSDAGTEAVQRVAKALHAALEPPFHLQGTRLHIRASIGAAIARLPRDDPGDLLRRADVAMYQAKGDGGGGLRFYTSTSNTGSQDRLRRIDELRQALTRGDIVVHVQPQVSLRRGQIVGVEALARWRHPKDGVLLPQTFLPLAAQTGLVRPVARSIIDASLAACALWWHAGHEIPVAVNLTAEDLSTDQTTGDDIWLSISQALRLHELPGQALHIEITEESLLRDPSRTARLLQTARAAGVKIALDDYGTGYSSLAYLRQLPVDVLKLDQVFARNIAQRTTTTIVRHTVAMAHGLGLRVVAEGIEDDATARALTDLGCDVGQGLFFSDAVTPEAFIDLITGRTPGA